MSTTARLPPGATTTATRRRSVFVAHDLYRETGYAGAHPLAIARVGPVMDLCEALDWWGPGEFRVSPRASAQELRRFHTPHYVAAVREVSTTGQVPSALRERYGLGTMENPLFPGLYERAATSVGGSIYAARRALEGCIAFHPAGGTHHGRPDRASGFCFFNDPVFAILTLLDGRIERLLYVDLDAHHGDAVQDAFAADPRVFTLSIHEEGRWPHTGALDDRGAGRACNLPVPRGFNDTELAFLMDDVVLPLARSVAPQAVVLTCGADALAGDPLARMALSNVALSQAAASLAGLAPAAVVLGGGGYNPWTVARYWTTLWGRLSGRTIPTLLPASALAVLERLACDLVDEEDVRPAWRSTLADLPAPGPLRPEVRALAALAVIGREPWTAPAPLH